MKNCFAPPQKRLRELMRVERQGSSLTQQGLFSQADEKEEHLKLARRFLVKAASALPIPAVMLLAFGVALTAPTALQAQSVSFAGVQRTVGSGFVFPAGVAVDAAGNVFVADLFTHRVVKVSPDGTQTTVSSGQTSAAGVAVNRAGDVFIADDNNNQVVKVPADGGAQTTVVSGLNQPSGLAVDEAGDLFVTDTFNNRVVEVPAGGGAQITLGSGLYVPQGVGVDGAGDVFIADTDNNRVVEVPAGGGAQITVGSGLVGPSGVVVDPAGNIYIADTFHLRVVKIPAGGGAQTTVGSGLEAPIGLALDGAGDLFIADFTGSKVVKMQLTAVNFGTVNICPSGQASPAPCSQTLALNYDVTAGGTLGAVKVLTQGAPNLDFTLAGGSTCAGDVTAGASCTVNVSFAPRLPGVRMGAVELTDSSGNVLATTLVYGEGQGPAIAFRPGVQTVVASGITFPQGVAADAAGNVFVVNPNGNGVLKIPAGGGAPVTVVSGLTFPRGLAVDGAGDLFIADEINTQVLKVAPDGTESWVGSGVGSPLDVAVDGAGDVFIMDTYNNRVLKVPAGGGAQSTVVSGQTGLALALDGAGNLFLAESPYNQVVKIPAGGGAPTTVGSGLNSPYDVAVDAAGNVFIADAGNNRVVEVPVGGGVQTTVGSGLNYPTNVAVDATGNVFISDANNNRVLEVQRSMPPTLSFAATTVGSTSNDSPQSVTIENIGNAALTETALTVGANFQQVPGSGAPADCNGSFTLAPGEGCNLSISFNPTLSGALQSSALLTNNALNANPATQTINLQGTGVAVPQTITFGAIANQVQGTPLNLTASASSGLAVGFSSLTPSVCTAAGTAAILVAPGTCTIQASQAGNAVYAAATPVSQSFTVIPSANFTIAPTPPAETVSRGVVGGFVLQLKSVNGFNGSVRLSCAGGPTGSYCLDLPGTVHVNGTAYAISGILFPKTTRPGTYTITFTGVSGSLTNTATAKFTVK